MDKTENCKNIVSFPCFDRDDGRRTAKNRLFKNILKNISEFVTETSFDFFRICDIIYHAEENGRKADRK